MFPIESRADQQDQERNPQRCDDEDVDRSREFGNGRDVAVAGRRQRHRSVVEAIQKRQPIALGVEVAVAVDVDDPGGEQQRHHSDDHPA